MTKTTMIEDLIKESINMKMDVSFRLARRIIDDDLLVEEFYESKQFLPTKLEKREFILDWIEAAATFIESHEEDFYF